jgi:putative restriction endonuclease
VGWEKPAIPAPSPQQLVSLQKERETRFQEILVRRGQATFRDRLIAAYGKCAVTGCDAEAALEAAHIIPYSESFSDCPTNGLLLRADIHTLFDLYLIGIDPQTLRVSLSPTLLNTTYRKWDGRKLVVPSDPALQPSQEGLAARWIVFHAGA